MPIQARHLLRRPGATPRWWIGVDGGGTHTRLRCTDAAGTLLGEGQAGASALGQGPAQAWAAVDTALRAALGQVFDADAWAHCAIGLGLSGAGSPVLAQAFLDAAPPCAALALDTDGVAALLGAHGGQPGALLIAGTGSVGEALLGEGRHRRVGGWGWQIGDEGSGAWLGRQAIQHTQRALDGRSRRGALAAAVLARTQALSGQTGEREAVLAWCAAGSQRAYADLAPLVFEHAGADPAAEALLQAAAHELDALAEALDGGAGLPLVLSGSVALRLQTRLAGAVRARCVAPQSDAQDGALQLIRNLFSNPQR